MFLYKDKMVEYIELGKVAEIFLEGEDNLFSLQTLNFSLTCYSGKKRQLDLDKKVLDKIFTR